MMNTFTLTFSHTVGPHFGWSVDEDAMVKLREALIAICTKGLKNFHVFMSSIYCTHAWLRLSVYPVWLAVFKVSIPECDTHTHARARTHTHTHTHIHI